MGLKSKVEDMALLFYRSTPWAQATQHLSSTHCELKMLLEESSNSPYHKTTQFIELSMSIEIFLICLIFVKLRLIYLNVLMEIYKV